MNARSENPDEGAHLPTRGSDQGGLRQYNERVVLQAVRLQGALPGAEIARLTGLTAQTVSVITKRLLQDGLLRKGEPVRGKVGQPSVPLSLHPEGAYAVGIKVGRRSVDTLLVDFTGQVCQRWQLSYAQADPKLLLPEIRSRLQEIGRKLGPERRGRVQGIGVAAPLALGGWQSLLGMPPEVADTWQAVDLAGAIAAFAPWPVTVIKDTAAACLAELVTGRGRSIGSFLYIFVDTFIGGGLVLDSKLRGGLSGNAGAVGSMPLWPAGQGRDGASMPPQLLSVASLLPLEKAYAAAGLDSMAAADGRALQAPWQPITQSWLETAAAAIAQTIVSSACLLDIDSVVLDGSFSRELLAALLDRTAQALSRYDWEGVARPPLQAGTIGSDARALGGALLPLHANFSPNRDLFIKLGAREA